MKILEYFSLILSILAFVFSLWSFFVERKRNRNEATIHAFDQLEEQVFSQKDYSTLAIKAGDDYCNGKRDGSWQAATSYLSKIEHFCAGIRLKTYDIDTLNRLAGGFIIEQYHYWTPIINTKRLKDVDKKMQHYDEFEAVAKELCKKRGQTWDL